jgi:hypothetical protein
VANLIACVSEEQKFQPGRYLVHLRLLYNRRRFRSSGPRGGWCYRKRGGSGGLVLFKLFHFGFKLAHTV